MSTCEFEGCARKAHARGLCTMHYERFRRHGDASVVMPLLGRPLNGDVPTFAAIHKRLSRTRGPASQFACVDCGGSAREWSYDQGDPDQVTGETNGSVVTYSLDIQHYVPRCVSCHRRFDGAGNRDRDEAGRFTARATRRGPIEDAA